MKESRQVGQPDDFGVIEAKGELTMSSNTKMLSNGTIGEIIRYGHSKASKP